jgi:hypothetical protein
MGIFSALWTGAKMIMGVGSGGGGGSAVMEAAKGVGNFIDEQKFTTEEAAVHNAGLVKSMQSFMDNTVSENTMRSKTRRDLALLIIRWALIMLTFSAALHLGGLTEQAKYIRDLVIDDPIGYLVLGVGAFFFGAHIVRAMKK